jgi:GDP-L-fucose synthase
MSNSDILVLGGSGFVGHNVVDVLRDAGFACVSSSRKEGTDLREVNSARDLLIRHRPKFIINCAAHVGSLNYVTKQAADVIADNTRMILNIYDAVAAECPGAIVINPIANCAYPATASTFQEDHWWDGHLHQSVLSYGSTRRLLWSVAECFRMQHGVTSVHFLVPNMYGPFDSSDPNKAHALNALACKFVRAEVLKQREVTVWGTGAAVREWLYAADFGRIVGEFLSNPGMVGLHEPLNIGQNFGLSVRELVNVIRRVTGFSGTIRYDESMPDGAPRKVMDDRRFRKVFPKFLFTDFESGLLKTVEYYRNLIPDQRDESCTTCLTKVV